MYHRGSILTALESGRVLGCLQVQSLSMTFTCLLERFSVCAKARDTTNPVGGCTSGC